MSIWVRNEHDRINDPTPNVRPAWETHYELSDGVTGPRSLVVKLTSANNQASGILIAPNLVLTASHVVEPGTGDEWTATLGLGAGAYLGIDDLQLREYTGGSDLLTSDLAVLQIEDTGVAAEDLFGLMVFSAEPGTTARQVLDGPAVTAGFPGQLYDTEAAAISGNASASATGPMYEMGLTIGSNAGPATGWTTAKVGAVGHSGGGVWVDFTGPDGIATQKIIGNFTFANATGQNGDGIGTDNPDLVGGNLLSIEDKQAIDAYAENAGYDADDLPTDVVFGSDDGDVLLGSFKHEIIYGDPGADTIVGAAGNDQFLDGSGSDVIEGGEGIDTFFLADDDTLDICLVGEGVDVVYGGTGTDRLAFRASLIDVEALHASDPEWWAQCSTSLPNGLSAEAASTSAIPMLGGYSNYSYDEGAYYVDYTSMASYRENWQVGTWEEHGFNWYGEAYLDEYMGIMPSGNLNPNGRGGAIPYFGITYLGITDVDEFQAGYHYSQLLSVEPAFDSDILEVGDMVIQLYAGVEIAYVVVKDFEAGDFGIRIFDTLEQYVNELSNTWASLTAGDDVAYVNNYGNYLTVPGDLLV